MSTKSVVRIVIGTKEYDAFPIGELSRRLNRTTQTIRKWEREGVIPEALRDVTGRRVYLESHIEGIIRALNECKVEPGKSLADAGFPAKVREVFSQIQIKILEETGE